MAPISNLPPAPAESHPFLALRRDPVFRAVFGNQMRPGPLRSLLSSILRLPSEELQHLEIIDPRLGRRHVDMKETVVDVRVQTRSGRIISVEIQLQNESGFNDRLIYYGSRIHSEQLKPGQGYATISQTIVIAITNFVVFHDQGPYTTKLSMTSDDGRRRLSNSLQVWVLELPKVPETTDESLLWDWLSLAKASSQEELDMIDTRNPDLAEAVCTVSFFNAEYTARYFALREEMAEHDRAQSRIEAQRQGRTEGLAESRAEGLAEVLAEGMAEGLAQGLAEGRFEGMAEGRAEGRADLIRRLLAGGLSAADVAHLTSIDLEEIERLIPRLEPEVDESPVERPGATTERECAPSSPEDR
ncbi:MAG: Rpn family recombination-promoting nuclease/putative transposase [Propionibacteriaceae bacterium]|nr:Rpn family recombination-promoting nuclease/putative transposase [Propionibacteriaceae bacterium]